MHIIKYYFTTSELYELGIWISKDHEFINLLLKTMKLKNKERKEHLLNDIRTNKYWLVGHAHCCGPESQSMPMECHQEASEQLPLSPAFAKTVAFLPGTGIKGSLWLRSGMGGTHPLSYPWLPIPHKHFLITKATARNATFSFYC